MIIGNGLIVKTEQKYSEKPAELRAAFGKLSGTVGICCNILLCIGKLLIGIISSSVSITADAVNNLSDAASSVVTLLGFKLASKKADRDHPYGHGRIEYMSGLFVAVLIIIIGVQLVKSSFEKILHPEAVEFSVPMAIVLGLSIAVKLWMSVFNRTLGKKIKSAALLATSADSRNDAISTSAVLLACIVGHITGLRLDGYIGMVVAVFILWSGIGIIKETIDPLLGQAPDPETVKEISDLIMSHEGVLGMHDMMLHDYGPGRKFASAHAEVDYRRDVLDAHETLDDIEQECREKLGIDLVLHYDPIVTDDAELTETRQQISTVLLNTDSRLKLHDFRMVRGQNHTNVIFDLVIPFEFDNRKDELKKLIEDTLSKNGKKYNAVISFDLEAFNNPKISD